MITIISFSDRSRLFEDERELLAEKIYVCDIRIIVPANAFAYFPM